MIDNRGHFPNTCLEIGKYDNREMDLLPQQARSQQHFCREAKHIKRTIIMKLVV